MYFNKFDIENLDRIKRLNIINSIVGIRPANLIGTVNKRQQSNLAIFSSVMHLGSSPALLGFILRPEGEVKRNTYDNIKQNGFFTINHVNLAKVANSHATSAKFPEHISEFTQCGFQEQWIDGFGAPFVEESPLKIGLKFVEALPIQINGTTLIIGSVEHLIVEEDQICEKGYINLESMNSIGVSGLNTYYELKKINTFPYARLNNTD